jgi:hypothetical protein
VIIQIGCLTKDFSFDMMVDIKKGSGQAVFGTFIPEGESTHERFECTQKLLGDGIAEYYQIPQ